MNDNNLNALTIEYHQCDDDGLFEADNSVISRDQLTWVLFRNLDAALVSLIKRADLVLGCVAWLTSEPILRALAKVPHGVSLVVQKEDFLRPDVGGRTRWKTHLRDLYSGLPEPPERHNFPGLVSKLSMCANPGIDPVRCVGNHNTDKNPAFPRMHNKFLVFCRYQYNTISPYSVWTGSFNFTKNATLSLENAIVLSDPGIVDAYYKEWGHIVALSESLDWESEWSAPEWRVGS
jgi:hypothetical protein